jgi:hypothetical protein
MNRAFWVEALNGTPISDGVGWLDASDFNVPFSVVVEGMSGADRVQVRVSNADAQPGPTDDEQLFGSELTTAGILEVTAAYRWVKVMKSAADASPGTTIAKLYAQLMLG